MYVQIPHNKLDLKKCHHCCVPHTLSIDRKNERVSYSKLFLTVLMEEKVSGFLRSITGEESWFFFYHPWDSVWAASHEESPQRLKQSIDAEKCLVSILWSVNGIHSLRQVPKGTTYNITLFTDVALPSLIENDRSRTRE
jgi:hypothetical protein